MLLERVGLTGAANRRVGTYSGGMRRRLDLALSLVHEPSVLFLDEPTTGLDPTSRTALWEEVRRLNAEGTTVFLTTQYLEEADELAGRVAIIDDGRIVREGSPQALKAAIGADTLVVSVGADARGAGGRGARAVRQPPGRQDRRRRHRHRRRRARRCRARCARSRTPGIAVEHVELDAPSLDDVFADATGRRLEGAAAPERGARGGRVTDRRRRPRRTARCASARARRWPRRRAWLAARSAARSASRRCGCPGLLFPMFIAAVNTSTMGEAIDFLPGFEGVDSLLQFLLPASITQSVLFGGLNAGQRHRHRHPDRLLRPPARLAGGRARRSSSAG